MEHKRDATVAGLAWPSNPNGGPATTAPETRVRRPSFWTMSSCCPWLYDLDYLGTFDRQHYNQRHRNHISPNDTYSGTALPDVPFPTEPSPTYIFFHRAHFSSRVVHQIHFKIITHSNNTRELFIEEIPMSGLSKCRDPEQYFYGLSGSWEWSLRTADYWRHHFEIPLVHGHHPFHNVPIETISSTEAPRLTTQIQELAKQLSATLTEARASGQIHLEAGTENKNQI